MISYTGTSIEDKPAWMKRGEKLHLKMHQQETGGKIPTVQEVIKYIDCWLEFHNKNICPNDKSKTIKECLADCEQRLKGSEKSETVMPFNASNQERKI